MNIRFLSTDFWGYWDINLPKNVAMVTKKRYNEHIGGAVMKRIVSALLILVMLFACLPLSGFAATQSDIDSAYAVIVTGIKAFDERINVFDYQITLDEFIDIYNDITFNEPLLFSMDDNISYNRRDGYIYEVIPVYAMTESEYETCLDFVNNEIDKILATLPTGLDNYETALYLHDYICLNFEYDYTYSKRDVYTMLKDGSAVCQGYQLLYDELMTRVDIPVSSVYSESINHIWNQIQIDGEWYHVDATWDDPSDYSNNDIYAYADHENFLVSDSMAATIHGTNDMLADNVCDSTRFDNASWHGVTSAFGFANGNAYAMNGSGINLVDIKNGTSSLVFEYTGTIWKDAFSSYFMTDTCFGSYADMLIYYSDTTFFVYDPVENTSSTLYAPELGSEHILAFYINGNVLNYITYITDDQQSATNHTYTISFEDKIGDVDGDGVYTALDYSLLKRYVVGTYQMSESQLAISDINDDGRIDSIDYVLLKRAVVGTYVIK